MPETIAPPVRPSSSPKALPEAGHLCCPECGISGPEDMFPRRVFQRTVVGRGHAVYNSDTHDCPICGHTVDAYIVYRDGRSVVESGLIGHLNRPLRPRW